MLSPSSLITFISHKYAFFLSDINGGYSAWSQWGACDKKCGSGFQHRKRQCTNPKPSGNGKDCSSIGAAAQKKACKLKDCEPSMKIHTTLSFLLISLSLSHGGSSWLRVLS